ncbi:MAG: ribonuclease H-like domain-containing protein [Lachnospiraceae bacterium]|nr:ribonuclease H-like domain-containing protein [Lachnospiraceae bacterium]
MLQITKEISYTPSYPVDRDTFFLCIDTTGFQAEVSAIATIGIAYLSNQKIIIEQWFNNSGLDQKELLLAFFEKIHSKHAVITYYGNRFSLPFLEKKCQEYNLINPLSSMESKDYYEMIHPFQRILGLSSCRQSAIEAYFGCQRSSNLSGKKLVRAYQNYIKKPDTADAEAILLHNQDSLEILLQLISIFSYNDLLHGNFTDCRIQSITSKQILFCFDLPFAILKSLQYSAPDCHLSLCDKKGLLSLSIDNNMQFKHYFPNPKDYYYLTVEDRAVHKSLASYVPKEFKQKATHATCYEKLSVEHPALRQKHSLCQFIVDTIRHLICIS